MQNACPNKLDNRCRTNFNKSWSTCNASCSCFSSDYPGIFLMHLGAFSKIATGTQVWDVGLLLILDLIFPILIYKDHTLPSPEKFVRCVASEAKSTGTNVEPMGRVICDFLSIPSQLIFLEWKSYLSIPPPRSSIHFRIHSLMLTIKVLHRGPKHMLSKGFPTQKVF